MSGATRMRRARDRAKLGLRVAVLEVNAERVRDCLIADGRISMASEANADAHDRALERVIEAWCRSVERRRRT